jgi:SAM-dependent methyltransferase
MNNAQTLKRIVPAGLWPLLGSVRRFVRSIPVRTRLQKKKLLSDPAIRERDRELLSKVASRVYRGDWMYDGDGVHYFKVGLSAIDCIDDAIAAAQLSNVRRILDLPCGGGRVLRFLVHRFPDAEITACELDRGPVEFCARTFGAQPAYSSQDLSSVALGKRFDLIWCGSLVTHLNEKSLRDLLEMFRRHLAEDGLLIFTTHGDFVARRLPTRDYDYLIADGDIDRMVVEYEKSGFAFADYPETKDWGVSLTSPAWIRSRVEKLGGLREVYFQKQGWDNHQDVFAFVRR